MLPWCRCYQQDVLFTAATLGGQGDPKAFLGSLRGPDCFHGSIKCFFYSVCHRSHWGFEGSGGQTTGVSVWREAMAPTASHHIRLLTLITPLFTSRTTVLVGEMGSVCVRWLCFIVKYRGDLRGEHHVLRCLLSFRVERSGRQFCMTVSYLTYLDTFKHTWILIRTWNY